MPLTKVSSGVIAANAVVDSFGTQSITGDKIGLGAITGNTLASNIINANNIVGGAVTGDKLGATSINANNIVNASITGDKIATGQITGNLLTANCVSGNNIVSSPTITGNVTINGSLGIGGATTPSSGVGIKFPGTQVGSTDANTLDDYEEGSWTPSYSASNGVPFSSVTYQEQAGFYTKIGNIVFVQGRLRTATLTIGSASGEVFVNNLPFTCVNDSIGGRNAGSLFAVNNWNTNNPSAINAESGNVYCQLGYRTTSNGAVAASQITDLQTGTGAYNSMFFSLAYRVA